ncbi:hypothetical protein GQ53DRAFT_830921 [Thozetella sp. PMI_491]|nr:hypothetical protein GQ53DRAFT_830921 [Thozetella sp. PMI_491]
MGDGAEDDGPEPRGTQSAPEQEFDIAITKEEHESLYEQVVEALRNLTEQALRDSDNASLDGQGSEEEDMASLTLTLPEAEKDEGPAAPRQKRKRKKSKKRKISATRDDTPRPKEASIPPGEPPPIILPPATGSAHPLASIEETTKVEIIEQDKVQAHIIAREVVETNDPDDSQERSPIYLSFPEASDDTPTPSQASVTLKGDEYEEHAGHEESSMETVTPSQTSDYFQQSRMYPVKQRAYEMIEKIHGIIDKMEDRNRLDEDPLSYSETRLLKVREEELEVLGTIANTILDPNLDRGVPDDVLDNLQNQMYGLSNKLCLVSHHALGDMGDPAWRSNQLVEVEKERHGELKTISKILVDALDARGKDEDDHIKGGLEAVQVLLRRFERDVEAKANASEAEQMADLERIAALKRSAEMIEEKLRMRIGDGDDESS